MKQCQHQFTQCQHQFTWYQHQYTQCSSVYIVLVSVYTVLNQYTQCQYQYTKYQHQYTQCCISLHSASIIIQNISIIYTVLHQFTQCYLVRLCNVQNFVCFSASFYCRQCSRVLTKTSDCSSINILYYIVGQESLMGNQDLIQAPV